MASVGDTWLPSTPSASFPHPAQAPPPGVPRYKYDSASRRWLGTRGRTAEGQAQCPSLRGSDSSVWTRNPGAGLAPHFHRLPPSGFQPRVLQVFTRGRSAPSVPPACSKHRERALQGDSALAGRGVDAAQPPRRPPPARARPSQPGRGSLDSFLCAGALGAERSVAAVFPDPPHLDPLHPAVPTASSVQDRAALSRGSWGTGGEGAATRPQRMGSSSHRPGRLREGKSLPSSHSWQVETGTGLRAAPPPLPPQPRAPVPHCYVRLCWVRRGASPAVPEDLSRFYSATVHALDGIRALTLSPQFLVSSAAFPGPLSEKRNHRALIHRS